MDPEKEEGQESIGEIEAPIDQGVTPELGSRYVSYHQTKETGIIDTETNEPIGADVMVILSIIPWLRFIAIKLGLYSRIETRKMSSGGLGVSISFNCGFNV